MNHVKWILMVAGWGWLAVIVGTALLGTTVEVRLIASLSVLAAVVAWRLVSVRLSRATE